MSQPTWHHAKNKGNQHPHIPPVVVPVYAILGVQVWKLEKGLSEYPIVRKDNGSLRSVKYYSSVSLNQALEYEDMQVRRRGFFHPIVRDEHTRER